jgi:hypothetical protein
MKKEFLNKLKEDEDTKELITDIAWDLWQTESDPEQLKMLKDHLKENIDKEVYDLIVEEQKLIKQKFLELKQIINQYNK